MSEREGSGGRDSGTPARIPVAAERLAQIRARLAAATPGPWEDNGAYSGDVRIEGQPDGKRARPVVWLDDDGGCSDPECCGGASYRVEINAADADLIVHAPADIAWLLEQLQSAECSEAQ